MDQYIDQMTGVYNAGFPYAALMLALAVPDICATLELPTGSKPEHQHKRYKRWFDTNLAQHVTLLSADDCWSLRCGVIHEGKFGNKDKKFDKVFFSLGVGEAMISDSGFIGSDGILKIVAGKHIGVSLPKFIDAVCFAVTEWLDKNAGNPNVQGNLAKLVRWYPNGFPVAGGDLTLTTGAPCIG